LVRSAFASKHGVKAAHQQVFLRCKPLEGLRSRLLTGGLAMTVVYVLVLINRDDAEVLRKA
jgi:hypothetical protein